MRTRFPLAVVAVMAAGACTDSNVTSPLHDTLIPGPSFAIVDAGHDGPVDGFWFLPPLAKQVTVEGTFDAALSPSMKVCLLDGNPSAVVNPDWADVACDTQNPVTIAEFAPGSAAVGADSYQFSWDTDGSENQSLMDPGAFYRINISIEDVLLGYLDVNPQRPSGETPGEDFEDLYAFRIGETLPVKFFLTPQARCSLAQEEEYVIQCVASGVVDANGGVVTLEPEIAEWVKISTVVPAGALPDGFPMVILTLERIDPDLFFQQTGEHCIPGLPLSGLFDAPVFGDCLRVSTDPELPVELEAAALIEICIDPFTFQDLDFANEQDERLQIIRFDDGTNGGAIQGLPNVDATTCGAPPLPAPGQLGFFPVPEQSGFFRTAAIAANTFARWVGPESLVAHGAIRLAGATTEFSRFQWSLPGEMTKESGDGTIIQQEQDGSESYVVPVEVKVVDAGGIPVSNAMVHFTGGTVDMSEATTGADGIAATSWTVPSTPGPHTLDAQAVGLLDAPVPDHSGVIDFVVETVSFAATVVGMPETTTQSPDPLPPLTGLPGQTLDTPLTFTVVDVNGLPVSGWDVTWTTTCAAADQVDCDGTVAGSTTTDANGTATGFWTLATIPGSNTATATVGGTTFTFTAGVWNATGQCLVEIDGVFHADEWACAEAAGDVRTFLANISGGDTPAEVRWQNDGTNLQLLVRVEQSSLAKANSLRVDFDNTLDGPTPDDDAIGFEVGSGFIDEYLTSKCVNRSQSGCGSTDPTSIDGEGAFGNDGLHTVYELSHPLMGTEGEDIRVAVGGQVGVFLTLRIGNGAQGNAQYPGFRDSLVIDIR